MVVCDTRAPWLGRMAEEKCLGSSRYKPKSGIVSLRWALKANMLLYTMLADQVDHGRTKITPCLVTLFHSFHCILFYFIFFCFSNPTIHLIFFTHFFNFPNPYTISLNLNNLYHLEIHRVKPFYIMFLNYFQTIQNHFSNHLPFGIEWNAQNELSKQRVIFFFFYCFH